MKKLYFVLLLSIIAVNINQSAFGEIWCKSEVIVISVELGVNGRYEEKVEELKKYYNLDSITDMLLPSVEKNILKKRKFDDKIFGRSV